MEYPLLVEALNEVAEKENKKEAALLTDALTRTVTCKQKLREQIAADVEAYLNGGGGILILPPGKTTEHEDSWGVV